MSTKREPLNAKQLKLLRAQAFEHYNNDCGCPELPCREAGFATGVLCLLEDYARARRETAEEIVRRVRDAAECETREHRGAAMLDELGAIERELAASDDKGAGDAAD